MERNRPVDPVIFIRKQLENAWDMEDDTTLMHMSRRIDQDTLQEIVREESSLQAAQVR